MVLYVSSSLISLRLIRSRSSPASLHVSTHFLPSAISSGVQSASAEDLFMQRILTRFASSRVRKYSRMCGHFQHRQRRSEMNEEKRIIGLRLLMSGKPVRTTHVDVLRESAGVRRWPQDLWGDLRRVSLRLIAQAKGTCTPHPPPGS